MIDRWATLVAAEFVKESIRNGAADTTELFRLAAARETGTTVNNVLEAAGAITNILTVLLTAGTPDRQVAEGMIDRLIASEGWRSIGDNLSNEALS